MKARNAKAHTAAHPMLRKGAYSGTPLLPILLCSASSWWYGSEVVVRAAGGMAAKWWCVRASTFQDLTARCANTLTGTTQSLPMFLTPGITASHVWGDNTRPQVQQVSRGTSTPNKDKCTRVRTRYTMPHHATTIPHPHTHTPIPRTHSHSLCHTTRSLRQTFVQRAYQR